MTLVASQHITCFAAIKVFKYMLKRCVLNEFLELIDHHRNKLLCVLLDFDVNWSIPVAFK